MYQILIDPTLKFIFNNFIIVTNFKDISYHLFLENTGNLIVLSNNMTKEFNILLYFNPINLKILIFRV